MAGRGAGVSDRQCYCFAGGGTGGHLTPGLALAAEIRQHAPESRIVFIGSDRPLEARLVAAAGYEHCVIPVESSEQILRHPLRFAWRNWNAYRRARQLLADVNPAAVIGLGGFASVPAVLAATKPQIPTLILEQNAIPGRATRILSRRTGTVCLTFEDARRHLPASARCALTGNPVRAEIAALHAAGEPGTAQVTPTLLVLGGSQGAESVNDAVCRMLLQRPAELAGWRIVHQTGAKQAAAVERAYSELGIEHVINPFFDDMAACYRQASLVVARAGATTLAELACAGCPAILLPYPYAADGHQHANAQSFAAAGAAVVVEHASTGEATAEVLTAETRRLCHDPDRRMAMRAAMHKLARPEAAQNVFAILQSIIAGEPGREDGNRR